VRNKTHLIAEGFS
jgi:hypothetical protein